jgi:hypothetical protein
MSPAAQGTLSRAPRPSSLADVLDLILDKGLVIDAYVRVSAVGIEILTIDARIVVASVDTYLHFAEAVNRLDLAQTETQGITGLLDGDSDEQGSDDGSNGNRTRGGRRSELPAQARGSEREDDGPGRGAEGGRQPANLVRRLADRGKWEGE